MLWNWCDSAGQLPQTLPEALPVQHCTAKDVGKLYMDARLYYVWNKLFRMDLVKQNGIAHKKDMDYGDDMIFCLDYIKAWFREKPNADFAVIQLPLYCYSVDNVNSMTRRYLPSYCGDELRLCDYLLDFFGRDFPIEDRTDRRRVPQAVSAGAAEPPAVSAAVLAWLLDAHPDHRAEGTGAAVTR